LGGGARAQERERERAREKRKDTRGRSASPPLRALTRPKQFIPPSTNQPTKPTNGAITVIEKYTRNARFCLICNYVSKVIPALQSRCTRFRFAPLAAADARARLAHVVAAESVTLGEGGMDALVTLGCGDMRRSLNILQACHMSAPEGGVDEKAVYATAGAPRPADVADVAKWLLNEPFNDCMRRIQRLQVDKGVGLADIVRELQP